MMNKSLLMAFAATVVLAACTKPKDDNKNPVTTTPKTKTEMLTAGKWQLSGGTVTYTIMGVSGSENLLDSMDACEKDNYLLFRTDGTVAYNEGATKCDSMDNQESYAQWKFHDNETKLIITESGYSDTANIDELSETVFKLSNSYSDDSLSMSYKMVQVFSRIN